MATGTLCLNLLEFAVLRPLRHLVDLALFVPNVEDGELLLVAVLSYNKTKRFEINKRSGLLE